MTMTGKILMRERTLSPYKERGCCCKKPLLKGSAPFRRTLNSLFLLLVGQTRPYPRTISPMVKCQTGPYPTP
jgi:hypothetical protein